VTTEHARPEAAVAPTAGGAPEVGSRYELREQLQTSVTGATWRAWDHSAGRLVDIRQMRPPVQLAFEQRRAMVALWARAAIRAQRGQFPGLGQVLDVLAADDELLVVTDALDGDSLADLLRAEGTVRAERASAVTVAIASVLEGLHASNLVHGDLRPSRVRLAGDHLWLVTYGLTSPDEDDPMQTLLASPAYLSPQRARGSRVSPADDIWALGVLTHAMVEGRPPFVGHSIDEVVDGIVNNPAPRCTSCSPQLADAVAAMLEKDPVRRPTSTAVLEMLSQPAVPAPAPAVPPTESKAAPRAERKTGSMDYAIPLVGILVLLILSALILSRL
jgi:serine/threonine protein kinase